MYYAGIEAFLAITRSGSLSKAAEALYVTQATISHRLKTLERELGAPLIDRHKGERLVSLTPFGEDFESIAERWDLLTKETNQLASGNSRLSLTIGAVDSVNQYIMPPLYLALTKHSSPFTLRVRTHQSWEIYSLVENREIDVGFTSREMLVHNVVSEPLFYEKMVVVKLADPKNHPNQLITLADLDPDHELYLKYSINFETWHDRHWDPFCPSRIVVDTVGLKISLFTNSKQWTIVPISVAHQLLLSGKFITQQLIDPPPDRICYMISHRKKRPSVIQALGIMKSYFNSIITPLLDHNSNE